MTAIKTAFFKLDGVLFKTTLCGAETHVYDEFGNNLDGERNVTNAASKVKHVLGWINSYNVKNNIVGLQGFKGESIEIVEELKTKETGKMARYTIDVIVKLMADKGYVVTATNSTFGPNRHTIYKVTKTSKDGLGRVYDEFAGNHTKQQLIENFL